MGSYNCRNSKLRELLIAAICHFNPCNLKFFFVVVSLEISFYLAKINYWLANERT
uniref:Uncharacterized protein n=1 Tax=Solanum lycopersicum TaxID=4081 RepID=A0A3Q7FPJ4_SOLLC